MARVTVEDCVKIIPNRFELSVLSSIRAKDIASGAPTTVDRDNHKSTVIALKEIGAKTVNLNGMRELLLRSLNKNNKFDGPELDLIDENSEENLLNSDVLEDIGSFESEFIESDSFSEDDDMSFLEDNLEIED